MNYTTDVLVIGGGPAGLAAAMAARHKGFRVAVAECRRPPIDKACGEGLMPDGLAALRDLGVEIGPARGYAFPGIRFVEGGLAAEARFPGGCGLGLRRTTLHEAMAQQAARAGIELMWNTRIVGLTPEGAQTGTGSIRCRWIVGADGGQSRVRQWAGLGACLRERLRFGFRRHYRLAPWTPFVELHWSTGCQIYVTPVGPEEVCVVAISRDPHLRLDDALRCFPDVRQHLRGAPFVTLERGAVTASRRLKSVYRGRVALIGDAAGSVDAITGEGLCLAFRQARALADALAREDLEHYRREHARLARRPEWMARIMLALDRHTSLRRRALRTLAARPGIFARMLALHVEPASSFDFAACLFALGWEVLTI
jgi:flavin-dependent dehydrogenase